MAENIYFKMLSVLVFFISFVAAYVVADIDYRVLMALSLFLFPGGWVSGWVSLKYYGTLEWKQGKNSVGLRGISEGWRRRVKLYPVLIRTRYGKCLILLLSVFSVHIYMVELHEALSNLFDKGSYKLSSGECKEIISGVERIIPIEACEKQFADFFGVFLQFITFFSVINIVLLFVVCPLIKQYNILYKKFEKYT